MTALVLDAHGDDAVLFACYTVLKGDAYVAVMHPTVPGEEIAAALWELKTVRVDPGELEPDIVYAPAPSAKGHDEHNEVAEWAAERYENVVYYATYAPRGQRTRTDNEVPAEPWMIAKKLRALSCFVSQIEQESTRPWFTSLLDLREWYA